MRHELRDAPPSAIQQLASDETKALALHLCAGHPERLAIACVIVADRDDLLAAGCTRVCGARGPLRAGAELMTRSAGFWAEAMRAREVGR
ncbi:MAG: hypothetical protein RQ833_11630 [Sphingomonadaceae bacterium]|nr:hypothetical protein [Sphingomonadaceae bacterium]